MTVMQDRIYERLLVRAWEAINDAQQTAENQGRHKHVRKLRHAAVVLNETHVDLLMSDRVAEDVRDARSKARLNGSIDKVWD
jgi:hypothetical protein